MLGVYVVHTTIIANSKLLFSKKKNHLFANTQTSSETIYTQRIQTIAAASQYKSVNGYICIEHVLIGGSFEKKNIVGAQHCIANCLVCVHYPSLESSERFLFIQFLIWFEVEKFRFSWNLAEMTTLSIGIVGAGLSGLCAAKYAKNSGHSVTIFEQNSTIGGTWVYTDATGKDEYGLDIHSSMYHDLR